MRARLLDLGEVGPVRSQSAYHAVLAGMSRGDDPIALLVRPAGPLVLIGESTEAMPGAADEIDLQECFEREIPIVRERIGGQSEVLAEGDLLVRLVLPVEKTSVRAVESVPAPVLATLADLRIDASADESGRLVTAAGQIGHSHAAVVDSAMAVAYSLYWSERGPALSRGGYCSLSEQMEDPICFAELAERFLAAIEEHFSLDCFPSLPTPSELEAIYEWDRRLLVETVEEASLEQPMAAAVH